MPNWCMNNLTVSHDDANMLQRFVDAYNQRNVCNEFIPIPEGYLDNGKWYDWCVSNWGTKWDFGKGQHDNPVETEDGIVSVSFESAWSPPIQLYEKLVELDYNVRGSYFEPGMSYCGIWDNGIDNYIEYGMMENKEDIIPVALWNEYAMDEFFEMVEEE